MTDSFQFNKNSKLFQNFITKKNNKNNVPLLGKPSPSNQEDLNPNKNRSFVDRPFDNFEKQERSTSNEVFSRAYKGPLHVTVDDIEEAASAVLSPPDVR